VVLYYHLAVTTSSCGFNYNTWLRGYCWLLGWAWASPFLVISMWTSSVCLSWMDRQFTVNHFPLLFCAFCIMR